MFQIEVKAVPTDKKDISDLDQGRKIRRVSQSDPLTFGGHPQPILDVPYEVTVNNKMCFYAITIMKAYQNYSFEELRFTSPAVKRSSESMLVRPNGDGSYSATWTPASVGWYSLIITIDGYNMDDAYKVEVKDPPQGMHPPTQNIVKKPQHQPNRLRRFIGKNSAGLRIRAHPSLQSEQIGIVPINGTITFVEEIHNDDGVWLRLNSSTIKDYCNTSHTEAWCLGYNQHLGKTLLLPVEEPKSLLDHVIKESILRKRPEANEDRRKGVGDHLTEGRRTMVVITSGASGHNIRSRPSLKASPVGMLTLGDTVTIQEYWMNGDGTWVRIDDESASKYCFSEGEAWSLAVNKHGVAHMKVKQESEVDTEIRVPNSKEAGSPITKGFDFSTPSGSNEGLFNFTSHFPPAGETNPFVFGSSSHQGSPASDKCGGDKNDVSLKFMKTHCKEKNSKGEREGGGKFSVLQKWLRGDDKERKNSPGRDFSELVGVSVKELVKAMGESRANGNGATPPETPRKTSRSSSPKNPQGGSPRFLSRSSSPVPIPGMYYNLGPYH